MNQLRDYFRAQADWRRGKAEQYPTDPGNLQSAEALDSLTEFVESTDHGTSEAGSLVDDLAPHLRDGSLGGKQVAREVARYGYGYPATATMQHEEFLSELVALCAADAYDLAREHEDDPTGTLYSFELEAAKADAPLPPQYWKRRARSTEDELEAVVSELTSTSEEGR